MDRTLPGSSVHGILHKDTGVGGHALLPGGLPNPGIELSLLRLLHWQVGSLPPAPPGSPRWLLTSSRNPSFSLPVIRDWSPTQTLLSRRVTASQCRAGSSCTPRISYESKSGSRSVMSVPATSLAIAHGMLQGRTPEWVAFPFSGDLPNPGLERRSPALEADSSPAEPQGKPKILEWAAYPFSRRSSQPRIEPGSPALQLDSLPTELSGKPYISSL